MNYQELSKTIHETAKRKGFWDSPRNTGELYMLITSELGEAVEAHRCGRIAKWDDYDFYLPNDPDPIVLFEENIKDTVGDEMADTFIRILDYMGYKGYLLNVEKDYKPRENFGEMLFRIVDVLTIAWDCEKTKDGNNEQRHLNRAISLIFSNAPHFGIDIERHIKAKMEYNATRSRLHGKKY
jgi:NTP pyrophosphatase (non-canonical NTP hydrolase)